MAKWKTQVAIDIDTGDLVTIHKYRWIDYGAGSMEFYRIFYHDNVSVDRTNLQQYELLGEL